MRIFVTGATGLVGRRLVEDRLARGDEVVALSRDAGRARGRLPNGVVVVEGDPSIPGPWQASVAGCSAVVHLAGANVGARRWTPSYKRTIVNSRVDSTHQVVEAIRMADGADRPNVLFSASAVGFYPPKSGDTVLTEASPPQPGDFFSDLARIWEATAAPARECGVRVVCSRTGLVLDGRGGIVESLARIFRFFIGGPIDLGGMWMPWIHWRDVVGMIDHALRTPAIDGPMNVVSPTPVRNREFSRALGRAIGRPSWLPVPSPALRIVLGEFGRYAAASQRVQPEVAEQTGYRFHHRDVHEAMRSLFAADADEPSPRPAAASADDPVPASHAAPPADAADRAARAAARAAADTARPTHPVRLVALPLDGALLEAGRVPAGSLAAARAAMNAGVQVVLATGRPPRGIVAAADRLGLAGPVVAYNGALVWDLATGTAVHHQPLSPEVAADVIAAVRKVAPDALVAIERLDRWYTDRDAPAGGTPEAGAESDGGAGAGERGAAMAPDVVGPLSDFLDAAISQLDIRVPAADVAAVRAVLAPFARERQAARYERPGGLFQIVHPMAEKAVALQRIVRAAGIDRDSVMAIGAGIHDCGLVEWAGFGVALADAPDAVQDLAVARVPTRADGGVARALTRFVVAAENEGRPPIA